MSCSPDTSLDFPDRVSRSASESSETERYRPLVGALNTILLAFRSRPRSDATDDPLPKVQDLIFMRNDPIPVSRRREYGTENNKVQRKPDIIAIFTSYLYKAFPNCQDYDFEEWCTHIGRMTAKRRKSAASKKDERGWLDILQPWEIKVSKATFVTSRMDTEYTTVGMKESDKPEAGSSKRKANKPLPSGSGKRSRSNGSASGTLPGNTHDNTVPSPSGVNDNTVPSPSGVTESDSDVSSADVQCAFYAIERLAAAWNVTHCTVVQLTGEHAGIRILLRLVESLQTRNSV